MNVVELPTAQLFWEYTPQQLADLPDGVVYARVMERGSIADYRWLLHAAPLPRLASWFSRHAGRELSPRALALWSCLLQQPRPPAAQIPWHA